MKSIIRRYSLILVVLVFVFIMVGCNQGGTTTIEDPSALALSGDIVDGVREIAVSSYQFDYAPEPIVVQQGEEVRLLLTTDDVDHGILQNSLGINVPVPAGETTTVVFTAEEAGEYSYRCNVQCGSGHSTMTGLIVVVEQ